MLGKRTKRTDFHSSQRVVPIPGFMIKHHWWVHRGTLGCWHVCVCAHRRVTHVAFFHWQSLGTLTQGGSKRSKHLQAGLGLNQHPRNKQYNKICLSSSHLFLRKATVHWALVCSDYLPFQVLGITGHQCLGCTQYSAVLSGTLCICLGYLQKHSKVKTFLHTFWN